MMQTQIRRVINTRLTFYLLFWAWNAIFLTFMLLGFAPLILFDLILAAQANIVPVAYLVYAALLVAIPIVCVLLGLTVLRREPHKLFALGYAVEGPLMLLIMVRFFIVRELTPALTFVFIVAALGMVTFVWQLLDKKIDERGALWLHLRVLGLTLYALIALYVGIWLAFYAFPIGVAMLRGLFEMLLHLGDVLRGLWNALLDFPRNLVWIPFMVFGTASFVFSATLFVLMPIAVPILVLRGWWRAAQTYIARFGVAPAAALGTATTVICIVLFIWLNQQPQPAVFALLENPPTTTAQAQNIAQQEATVRAGLVNAYLAPQRYISSVGEVNHIRELYNNVVGLGDADAVQVERVYEIIAAPLLYRPAGEPVVNARWNDGAMFRESAQAAALYEKYFDQEIVEGERETVLASLSSTWDIVSAQQALQTADDREIHLNKQELSFVAHGDWADFELHEEYQNETGTRQEVVYYITLPESAVITGVWLGNSDKRDERFVYRVAPRGAAQAVYRDQVRVNRDPALVEQIGPRQYRVRVFPLEPKTLGYGDASPFGYRSSFVRQGPPLHMWLTWRVMANGNQWTLPYLAEKRNVYWDANTVRTINGASLTPNPSPLGRGEWLPVSIPASAVVQPIAHRFDLPGGQTVIAQPMPPSTLPALPNDLRLAVVVDRSRSMAPHANAVNDALEQFKQIAARGNAVEMYLTASPYRGEQPSRVNLNALDSNVLSYGGGQNPAELLKQFNARRGADTYDAIFVLTDGTGYALGKSDLEATTLAMPVWFVHLDGKFPLGYDDATLQMIQASGGGVTDTVPEAQQRLALALALKRGETIANASGDAFADWVDGYAWTTLPTSAAQARIGEIPVEETFAPFAARRLILTNVQRERASLKQLNTLDELHALAKQYSVVSPYSSMIVLVNEFQQRQLDEAEKQADRFQRETEEVGNTQQNPFDVTAVPEPHEYLLLAIGAGLLVWYLRKRKRAIYS
ncbi:MAG: TIGR02921 family PEP-CTERM protein, partial [Chloroflexi bacterium]|nr:TIGR02921 family PEP-CTERM protein [Chloroflexota bacterium]